MKPESIEKAVALAKKIGHVLIATSDLENIPHIAAAGKLELSGREHLALTEWFCPSTLQNLQDNNFIAVVIWDKNSNSGFQLIAHLEKIQDVAIMDGYSKNTESPTPLPQIERKLILRVAKIIDFTLGPHSDLET